MNLIILTESDIQGDNTFRFTDNRAEHIRLVLRSSVGDTVAVGMLDGGQGIGRIEQITDQEIVLSCGEFEEAPVPAPIIDVICALPRPQTLKKVLATVATMGVRRLHLIRANRVEKSYYHSPLLLPENSRPHLLEGLSQGRQTRLPEVRIHERFRPFFEDTLPRIERAESTPSLMLLPDPEVHAPLDAHYNHPTNRLIVAIGPEGGWVPFEIDLMERCGFRRFTLGRWTLRVETAVAGVLSQIELLRMRHVPA